MEIDVKLKPEDKILEIAVWKRSLEIFKKVEFAERKSKRFYRFEQFEAMSKETSLLNV